MSEMQPSRDDNEARARAWLASLLMRPAGDILTRFACHYDRLARRPRAWRRQLRRKLAVTVTGAALLLALAGLGVRAETDKVITVVNGEVREADNGKCSLIEAISNANNSATGQPFDDCAAGNPAGADTIVLPTDGFFTLTTADNTGDYGSNGLPWIRSTITINGNGSTIRRKSDAPPFRILAVGPIGKLTLDSSTVSGGDLRDYYYGGGIFNQGLLVIQNSRIVENEVYSFSDWADGGGIFNEGDLSISNSQIVDNEAVAYLSAGGGGISNRGSVVLKDSDVSGNVAGGDFGYGGGIYNSGTLEVDNVSLTNNAAGGYSGKGGAIQNTGFATVTKSAITNNFVDGFMNDTHYGPYFGYGGGVDNTGTLTMTNVTVSNNVVEYGYGGGVSNRGRGTIISSTFSGNTNDGISAGCLFGGVVTSSNTNLLRTIVSGNSRFEIAAHSFTRHGQYCNPEFYGNANNLIGVSGNANSSGFIPTGTDIVPSVPLSALLYPLANNGGPTLTHALPPGSPAIDRAPNNACTAAPVGGVDQRGLPRNSNGAGGSSPNECDIGAFEFQAAMPTATSTPTSTPTSTATVTATTTGTLPPPPTQTPPPTGYPQPTDVPTATPTTPPLDYSAYYPVIIREYIDAVR